MKFSVEDLYDSVQRNDAFSFLFVYLNLILKGTSLSLPVNSDVSAVKQEWLSFMPIACHNCTDVEQCILLC